MDTIKLACLKVPSQNQCDPFRYCTLWTVSKIINSSLLKNTKSSPVSVSKLAKERPELDTKRVFFTFSNMD